jgi:hypothetical protein
MPAEADLGHFVLSALLLLARLLFEVRKEFPLLIESTKSVDEGVVRHLRHQLVAEFIGKLAKKFFLFFVRLHG